jgi:hypothetical protein
MPTMPFSSANRQTLLARVAVIAATVVIAMSTPAQAQAPTETVEFYGLDALGSVRVVFDPAGAVVGRMDYGPFGQELVPSAGKQQSIYAGCFQRERRGLPTQKRGCMNRGRDDSAQLTPCMPVCSIRRHGTDMRMH